jgi:hypothetical protein
MHARRVEHHRSEGVLELGADRAEAAAVPGPWYKLGERVVSLGPGRPALIHRVDDQRCGAEIGEAVHPAEVSSAGRGRRVDLSERHRAGYVAGPGRGGMASIEVENRGLCCA